MTHDDLVRKNARTGLTVLAVIVGMVALSFASVPLYKLFCKVTGFGGTTRTAIALPEKILDRTVTVKFNTSTGRNMPWEFRPEQREVTIRLGQKGLTSFYARNPGAKATAGTALFNVTPDKAGKYFNKMQCFCFDRQVLEPGQSADFPVVFFVDPAMAEDPDMQDVDVITLSYTFFESDSKDLEAAMEGFYNGKSPDTKGTQ
ncbi:MAG: cytochrome c oxidase assembly protein [Alphaproteobacteria bacterium]|nr:cytochrome c oxidase assembly protein [Alphaproteobacteria bacterium]